MIHLDDGRAHAVRPAARLRDINGEALAVPGLRFWAKRRADVFAVIAQDDRGAAELWNDESRRDRGGVELHSPTDWGRWSEHHSDCTVLGGDCWPDGSLSAWSRFAPLIKVGDSCGVLALLAEWHAAHFGGGS